MKELIKKLLREAVGVPQNIDKSARKVYDDLIYKIKSNPSLVFGDEITLNASDGKYNFADFNINSLKIDINQEKVDDADYIILGLSIKNTYFLDKLKFKLTDTGDVEIIIRIGTPINPNPNDIIKLLIDKKDTIIPVLAHELKHAYDNYKKKKSNIAPQVQYNVFSDTRFGNRIIDTFLFGNYYVTNIESLVRPSEIYSLAKEKNITQKDFLKFIEQTDVFKTLKRISQYGYDDFRADLKKNIQDIENILVDVGVDVPTDDDAKIDSFLRIFWITLTNITSEKMNDYLEPLSNPFVRLFGEVSDEEIDDFYEKFINRLRIHKNDINKFYIDTFKYNQISAKNTIKKMSKIYSLLPNEWTINDPASLDVALKEYEYYPKKRAKFTKKIR